MGNRWMTEKSQTAETTGATDATDTKKTTVTETKGDDDGDDDNTSASIFQDYAVGPLHKRHSHCRSTSH